MSSGIDKSLVKKYLDGNCTPAELQQIRKHLRREDTANIFDEVFEEDWAGLSRSDQTDSEQMDRWKKMMEQRIYQDELSQPQVLPMFRRPGLWRYAAVWLIVMLGAGIWAINKQDKKEPAHIAFIEKTNPRGQRTVLTLPDSSVVHLGAASRLRFAQNFNEKDRTVELEGEAFFEVTKNPAKPFVIKTGTIQTRVLGTSFKVQAFEGHPMSVQVSTGKVRVDRKVGSKAQAIALLLPGQQVIWDELLQRKELANVSVDDIEGWKKGRLVFSKTRLSDVTAILERWYNVDIDIKNQATAQKLMKVNLTADIPINRVIKMLSTSGQFTYRIHENQIIIN
ncbi:FecR family protein [Desertivirga xinjiangensis]|uniref:FecR family protein n=1 Tax=Desertivirga xinjiangensis TaxID=539206 RepID=UPI00210C9603|nr:FecR family protein [Pedobacter xinjiangensis]